jgi:hypothetical protein
VAPQKIGRKGLELVKGYESKPRALLTANELREWLEYDPETGEFYWLKCSQPRWAHLVGKRAGGQQGRARSITVRGRAYLEHRLAWLWMTGEWPADQVDHIDLDRSNNRWANLRQATGAQNCWNHRVRRDSTTGLKGVLTVKKGLRFTARITAHNRNYYLGCFKTAEEAHEAYCRAVKQFHGDFARTA